jgi:hypothetical protein
MSPMLDWMRRRRLIASAVTTDVPKPHKRAMTGRYLSLYTYLENRYANTVVLTFAEIEDLLGFSLPDQAHHQQWWNDTDLPVGGPNHSDSWVLASRTAKPNLKAQIVVFERES